MLGRAPSVWLSTPSAPPPSSTTASGPVWPRTSSTAASSSSRKASWPRSAKISVTLRAGTRLDDRRRPRRTRGRGRAASSGPRVDFPAPMNPTRATWCSSAFRIEAATRFAPGTRGARRRSPRARRRRTSHAPRGPAPRRRRTPPRPRGPRRPGRRSARPAPRPVPRLRGRPSGADASASGAASSPRARPPARRW